MGSATANVSEIQNIAVEKPVTDGELNKYISWSYADGVLTISGKGKMPAFNYGEAPWADMITEITAVVIEEGVTTLGRSSFHSATNLESVTLPESLWRIDAYAFYGCKKLKSVDIPEAVTSIGAYAFRKSGVKDVTIGITYGWSAGAEALTSVELEGNAAAMLKNLYKNAWTRDTEAKPETVDPYYVAGGVCGNGVKWTLRYTDDTKTTMKLTISGQGAMTKFNTAGAPWYSYAMSIVEVEVQEGVTTIGRCAFLALKKLTKVTLPSTITAIEDYAFNTCWNLKEIDIPEGCTKIGKDAFKKTKVVLD